MKKTILSAVAAVAVATPAIAADMKVKAVSPPPPPPSPWDVAFGAGLTSDYIFRGITQSNHNPSGAVYFEPRYNVTPYLQLYAGIAAESISFPNRAAAEIDGYFGIRPTFGPFALDFGGWYYWYPGGTCFNGSLAPVFGTDCLENGYLPVNGNVVKKDLSFWEAYVKGTYTFNDQFAINGSVFYSPSVLNTGANGTYVVGGAKFTASSAAMPEAGDFTCPARRATGTSARATHSTAPRSVSRAAPRRIRPAFHTRGTPPGTSASASPRACSRSTCATTTPTMPRVIAMPSPATKPHASRVTSPRSIAVGSALIGAARPLSPPASST